MSITNLKYNRALMKTKERLQKELKMIDIELEKNKKLCNHVNVIVGHMGGEVRSESIIERCLFCGRLNTDEPNPTINAITYQRSLFNDGSEEEDRINRLTALQELCIKFMQEQPNITEQELISKIVDEINKDEEKNKELEKDLGHSLILYYLEKKGKF